MNVYRNDTDWIIASSAREANRILCRMYGVDYEPVEHEPLPPHASLTIVDYDGSGKTLTKTICEWLEIESRPGLLASTEY